MLRRCYQAPKERKKAVAHALADIEMEERIAALNDRIRSQHQRRPPLMSQKESRADVVMQQPEDKSSQ